MDPCEREALTIPPPGSVLVVEKEFEASRERVWRAWTEPDQIRRWWGPKDFTAPFARTSLRVGGLYLFCMRSPDGRDFWSTGSYREITPYERIVVTDSFADEKGNILPASAYGFGPDFPKELLVTVTFEERPGGKTRLVLRHEGLPEGEHTENARLGWEQSLDKLADWLASAR
ncbi:MAG TPA: SRPBCC domain-containing protein [Acidobacteriota bacterium]|nr:SRPBCC domain-containing protein [Acidobacteriota bacterium]